ncbi:MAG TPA: PIG-L family deacetylase, partial [Gallionellaceae bacterium]
MWMRFILVLFILTAALSCTAAENALSELEQAATASPASIEAWDRYGMALARAHRFRESLVALDHALRHARQDDKHLQHHLALVYAWSGNYREAAYYYNELLRRYPRDNVIRIDYGQTLAWDLHYSDAAAQYKNVLATDPRNIEALRHLGELEAWQGRYDAALANIDRGLVIDARNPELVAERANLLFWKGELASAMKAYEDLVQLAPQNDGYWLRLAQVYTWNGLSRRARESYEKALSLDPGNIEAYLGLASIYRGNHQYDEAERFLRKALVRFPSDPRPANELAALTAQKSLSLGHMAKLAEPVFFVTVLLALAIYTWRERRVLRRRQLTVRVLLPALPVLVVLSGAAYVDVLYAGPYYPEAATAAQVLHPVALAALFTLLFLWRRFERPQRQKTVLAIGAHPDDIEFGCGATMLRLREEGAATYGLVLTGGECGHDESDGTTVRVDEACSAARVIALSDIEVRSFPDTMLHEHKAEIRDAIEEALARWRPDIIFTHNGHDAHTDHHTVFDATREAARGAYTILCYENPNTPPGFHPGYFFDVGKHIEGKIEALACHRTQMG